MAVVAVVSACGATAKTHRRDRPIKVCQAIPRYLLREDRESGCPSLSEPVRGVHRGVSAFDREFAAAALGETPTSLNAYREIVEALPSRLETAADLLAVGNIQGAADTLLSLATSVVGGTLLSPIGPVKSGLSAGAAAGQEVLTALKSGDPRRVLDAIIAAPAAVADGKLHGHSGFTGLLGQGGPVSINKAPTTERLLTLDLKAFRASAIARRRRAVPDSTARPPPNLLVNKAVVR